MADESARCEVIRDAINVLAWAVMLGALALLTNGCGGAVQSSARTASAVTLVHQGAGDVIDDARAHALDAVEAAHPQPGPDRSAALEAEAAKWQPIGAALDAMRGVLESWIDATALAAAGAELDVARVLRLARDLVRLYSSVVAAAEELGVEDLPEMPQAVRDFIAALGGG